MTTRNTAADIAAYCEKDGVNIIDIENECLSVAELRRKVLIAEEDHNHDLAEETRREIALRGKR